MSTHLDIGLTGELHACTHLQEQGYIILEKNWRWRRAEVDIICLKDRDLVFVEVKTRTSEYMGNPAEAVTRAKQKHLIRAADAYIKEYPDEIDARFDIIAIILNQNKVKIEHIKDAFYPTL